MDAADHHRLRRHLLGDPRGEARRVVRAERFVGDDARLPAAEHDWVTALSFLEAAIGLGVVALMISYLPTIYGAFARREALVGMLEVRVGSPASAGMLFARYETIGRLEWIEEDLFGRWEQWFTEVEESHTSQPALCSSGRPIPNARGSMPPGSCSTPQPCGRRRWTSRGTCGPTS